MHSLRFLSISRSFGLLFRLGLGLGLGVSAVVACSGSSASSQSGPESHGAVQTNGACTTSADVLRGTAGVGVACRTYADCAPVCCACSQSSRSFSRDATCFLSKKVDYCPGDPAPTDGGPSVDAAADTSLDASPPPATAMCIAFTGSHATDREAERILAMKQLIAEVTTSPGGGTLNVVRDNANRPTSATFSASGSAENYNVTITYDSAGNVTSLRRSWSGATQNDAHTLTYDSQNKLASFKLTWSGSKPTENEALTYDSSRRLTSWKRSKRLTSWKRVWSNATETETATFTYAGGNRTPASTNTSGPIPSNSHVVDCK